MFITVHPFSSSAIHFQGFARSTSIAPWPPWPPCVPPPPSAWRRAAALLCRSANPAASAARPRRPLDHLSQKRVFGQQAMACCWVNSKKIRCRYSWIEIELLTTTQLKFQPRNEGFRGLCGGVDSDSNSGFQMPEGHQEFPTGGINSHPQKAQPELQIPVPTHVPPPATSSPRVRGRAGTRVARSPTVVPGPSAEFGVSNMALKDAVPLDLMVHHDLS